MRWVAVIALVAAALVEWLIRIVLVTFVFLVCCVLVFAGVDLGGELNLTYRPCTLAMAEKIVERSTR
jgi:hypothetical protein